jgi:hypothetical protein
VRIRGAQWNTGAASDLTDVQGSPAQMLGPLYCAGTSLEWFKGMDKKDTDKSSEFWLIWLASILATADLIIYVANNV